MSAWRESGVRGGQGGVGRVTLITSDRATDRVDVSFTYDEARSILAHHGLPWEDDNGQHTPPEGWLVLERLATVTRLLFPISTAKATSLIADPTTYATFDAALRLGAAVDTEEDQAALRALLPVLK